MSAPLKVLVVDDSAVVRQALVILLQREGMEVALAADGVVATAKVPQFRPDVIVLDLDLPRMDGFAFLRWLMDRDRVPVVVCSGATGKGTDAAFRALREGAVDVVPKPRLAVEDAGPELIEAIRGAAAARPRRSAPASPARLAPADGTALRRVVVIGASTGGTEALHELLAALPRSVPGIVVVQHLPAAFTAQFAQQLDQACELDVREAADGDEVRPGLALIAPGGRHARLRRRGDRLLVALEDGPLVCRHRPSVDVLFDSAAASCGADALGVLLTGMGADGASGMVALRRAGAATLAQDEASCVVFGMPREAIHRGAVDEVVPLGRMAETLLNRIAVPSSREKGRHRD